MHYHIWYNFIILHQPKFTFQLLQNPKSHDNFAKKPIPDDMKKLTLLLIALCCILPSYGDSAPTIPTTPPERTEKLNPKEDDRDPNVIPQDFCAHSIYCTVSGGQATVYSPNSICGEIVAIDALTGITLCNITTNLWNGYSFSIPLSHPVMIYVTVDGISYSCDI